jgi:hypothetical protein
VTSGSLDSGELEIYRLASFKIPQESECLASSKSGYTSLKTAGEPAWNENRSKDVYKRAVRCLSRRVTLAVVFQRGSVGDFINHFDAHFRGLGVSDTYTLKGMFGMLYLPRRHTLSRFRNDCRFWDRIPPPLKLEGSAA